MDNKINLLPNSKHIDNNNSTNKKINREDFPMYIPDEEVDEGQKSETENTINTEEIKRSGEKKEENDKTNSKAGKFVCSVDKETFWGKIKNIFKKTKA